MTIRPMIIIAGSLALLTATGAAAVPSGIPFDGFAGPAASLAFDGNYDALNDVTFSSTHENGLVTAPFEGTQSFIWGGVLYGFQQPGTDLRVDFATGATGSLGFGFALDTFGAWSNAMVFRVYDAANTLLASAYGDAYTYDGDFPEGRVDLEFAGTAAYATFDFFNTAGSTQFALDNFTGTYLPPAAGGVPEPATWLQMILGFGTVGAAARQRARRRGLAQVAA